MLRKFTFDSNLTSIMGTLHEDMRTFVTISRWILLRIKNVSDKSCRENQNTHFAFSNFFFFCKSCHVWDNVEKYGSAREATGDSVCTLHAGWLRLQNLTICKLLLLFHSNNGYAKVSQWYVLCTWPVLFLNIFTWSWCHRIWHCMFACSFVTGDLHEDDCYAQSMLKVRRMFT